MYKSDGKTRKRVCEGIESLQKIGILVEKERLKKLNQEKENVVFERQ